MAHPNNPSSSSVSQDLGLDKVQSAALKKKSNAENAFTDKALLSAQAGADALAALVAKKSATLNKKIWRDDEEVAEAANVIAVDDAATVAASQGESTWVLAQATQATVPGTTAAEAASTSTSATAAASATAATAAASGSIVGVLAGGLAIAAVAGGGGSSNNGNGGGQTTAGSLALQSFTDTGNTTDKITSDKNFELSISGQTSGATVVYQRSTDGGNTWTDVSASQANLADGNYAFRAKVTNNGTTAYTDPVNITVDTAITAGTLSLSQFTDTGASSSDFLTSDTAFSLALTGQESGATVVYQKSIDGGQTWTTTTAAQTGLADGAYKFRTQVTDAAGNAATSNEISVTIDATAPVPTLQTASGTSLTLTFDSALDGDHLPDVSAFAVTQGGTPFTITARELVGTSSIKLTLGSALSSGALTVTYTDPSGNAVNAIQDAAGNHASTFTTGVLADGYISGATIQIDTNGDGVGDVTVGKTDAGGRFFVNAEAQALLAQGGVLMASGGFNIDTGVANTLVLKSAGALTINPLTTVIQAVAESSGISVADAAGQVADSLGINLSAGQSLADYDPIANGDTAAQKVSAQIATVATLAASTGANSEDKATASTAVMGSLADLITTAVANGSTDVSLTDANTLNSMVNAAGNGVVLSDELKSTIAQAATEISQATSLSDVSAKQSQFLDKVAPALPGIDNQAVGNDATPDLTFTLDISATDGTAAVATDKLVLMEGDRELATYALNAPGDGSVVDLVTGQATLRVPTALSDGVHTLKAFLVDQSGNVGTAKTFTVNIDTAAPLAPVVNVVAGDDVINASETSFTVTGAAEAGATIRYSSTLSTVAGSDGSWSLDLPASVVSQLASGNTSLSFTAKDAAGNVSAAGAHAITVDRDAPTVTSGLPQAVDNVDPTTGPIAAASTTNDNTPTFSGTLSAALSSGDQVVVYDGSTRLGVATVDGTSWTFNSPALSNAAHSITVRVQDAAGNQGTASAALAFTVQASVPTAVATITALADDVGTAQDIANNGLTNDAAPVLKGSLSAALASGEAVYVFNGKGESMGTATVSGTNWSLDLNNLSQGANSFTAVVQNAGGNQGAVSAAFGFKLDTIAPASSGISVNAVTGDNKVSGAEKTAGFTVTGSAEPGSQVQLTWGSTQKTATTSAAGQWSIALSSGDVPSDALTSSISVVATDAAGNASSAVTSANIVIDTTGPSSTTLNAVAGNNIINAAEAKDGVVLSGTTEANATVLLPIGASIVRSLTANVQGGFSYTLTQADIKALGDGAGKKFSMTAIDVSGNRAAAVDSVAFTIDTAAPVLSSFTLATGSDTGASDKDGIFKITNPTLNFTVENVTGTIAVVEVASVSAQGVVGNYSAVSGVTVVQGVGSATLALTNDGTYSVRVTATDTAGNTSVREGKYVLDTNAPAAPQEQFKLADSSDSGVKNDGISNVARPTAEFTLEKGATLASEYRIQGSTGAYTSAGSVVATGLAQTATMANALPADGTYEFHYTLSDVAGNTTEFSRTYTLDTRAPTVTAVTDGTQAEVTKDPIRFSVTFSEALRTDATADNFTANNGTVTAVTKVDATHYTVQVTPSAGVASGSASLNLVGGSLQDAAGNAVINANLNLLGAQGIDTLAPGFTSTATASVAENTATSTAVYTAVATDANTLRFSLSGTDASLLNIDSSTGAVTFKTSPNFEAPADSGGDNVYNFTVTATDAVGNASQKAVALTVGDVNEAPTARDIGPQILVNGQAIEGANLSGVFSDVDAGSNGTLSYALKAGSVLPAGLSLVNGQVVGTPTVDSAPVNVTFVATDGGGLSVEQTVSLSVVSAPTVQGFLVTDTTTSNSASLGKEGEALSFAVRLTEAVTTNGALTATFNVNGAAVTANCAQVNNATNTLVFTGATVPAGHSGSGITLTSITGAVVTGSASHQTLVAPAQNAIAQSTTAPYTVDNTAPTISTSSLSAAENSTAALNALAANETVTWSLGAGGDTALFNLSEAGSLNFKTAKNYEADVTSTHAYTVNVVATDTAGNQATKAITVNLTDVNEAPTADAISAKTVVNGQPVNVSLANSFHDVDAGSNGTLTYALKAGSSLPTGLSLASDGTVSGTPTADSAPVDVTFVATDGGGLSVEQTVSVGVVSAPTLKASALNNVTNLDVRSDIVLEFTDSITAQSGKMIHIVNDSNSGAKLGLYGESTTNTFDVSVIGSQVSVSGSKVTINLSRDLDFSNNYHIEIDQGAFVASGNLQSVAVSGASTLKFSTVTPATDKSIDTTTGISKIMMSDGTLADSLVWKDIDNWPAGKTGSQATLDMSKGAIALVTADQKAAVAVYDANNPEATATNVETGNFNLALQNFGANDLIYMDDLGRNNENLSLTTELVMAIQATSDGTNTKLNFDPVSNTDGGNIDVLAQSFATVDDWKVILSSTHAPILLG